MSVHIQGFINPVTFGMGALARLPKLVSGQKARRFLLCTDPGLAAGEIVRQVRAAMPQEVEVVMFPDTPGNPTEAAVEAAAAVYRDSGCDGLLGVGGGSSLDLAKVVGIAVTHPQPLLAYSTGVERPARIGEIPPLIAIPTTAGTGSESSPGAVIVMADGRKLVFGSSRLIPTAAICDPALTRGLPAQLTAATGMDAVTHCIEGFLSTAVHPMADAVALDGVSRALAEGWLERAVADGDDLEARWHMMMAAQEGAVAFIKPLGSVHALSHACGRIPGLNLHHGLLNALFLPPVLRLCRPAAEAKFERLGRAMGLAPGEDLAEAVEALNARLGLPSRLAELKVPARAAREIVDHALGDICHRTNVRPLDRRDYERLVGSLLD